MTIQVTHKFDIFLFSLHHNIKQMITVSLHNVKLYVKFMNKIQSITESVQHNGSSTLYADTQSQKVPNAMP